jgi:hypothetical protein
MINSIIVIYGNYDGVKKSIVKHGNSQGGYEFYPLNKIDRTNGKVI